MKPKIALLMIVKNEVKVLGRLLDSVRPLISEWVIIDTGSTDGTQKLIAESLIEIPGQIIERPWINFGKNRSELVSYFPDSADWAFLLDADQILNFESPEKLFQEIEKAKDIDVLMLNVVEPDGLNYRMPYLIHKGPDYFYVGATHEYLSASKAFRRKNLNSLEINHFADGGSKADKYERDVNLLRQEIISGRDNSRNRFYLAQSYESLNKPAEAIAEYAIAIAGSKWDEEIYICHLRSGRILSKQGKTVEALMHFMSAMEACPDRAEARLEAARNLSNAQKHVAALAILRSQETYKSRDRILFEEPWIKGWGIEIEIGVQLWKIKEIGHARMIFESILTRDNLPPATIALVKKNLSFC